MKKLILTLALVAATAASYGQGTISFSNTATSQVRVDGVVAPAGSALNFGVFFGGSAGSLSLSPTLGTISSTSQGIIWVGGAASTAYQLAGFAANTQPFVQIRGWSSSFGSDWAAAQAAFNAGTPGVVFGQTAVLQVAGLGADTGPGTAIWQSASGTNPQRFTPLLLTTAVPEPSTIALGVLGAGSLLFLRRKK